MFIAALEFFTNLDADATRSSRPTPSPASLARPVIECSRSPFAQLFHTYSPTLKGRGFCGAATRPTANQSSLLTAQAVATANQPVFRNSRDRFATPVSCRPAKRATQRRSSKPKVTCQLPWQRRQQPTAACSRPSRLGNYLAQSVDQTTSNHPQFSLVGLSQAK